MTGAESTPAESGRADGEDGASAVEEPREPGAVLGELPSEATPYAAFAAGTDHPDPDDMRGSEL